MDRLDREIMLGILGEVESIYKLERSLKDTNYATVWRRIKAMRKDGLVNTTCALRKDGEIDDRDTNVLELTNKGLATLIIDGDLKEEDLIRAGRKTLEVDERLMKGPMEGWLKQLMVEVFTEAHMAIRPKVNLKFFDEEWFRSIYDESYSDATRNVIERHKEKLVEEGIWASDGERKKSADELMQMLIGLMEGTK